jgi:hypothetical protein
MATAIQWRRGTTAQHANFTGLVGEITVDTDLDTVVVHDGSTEGGHRLAKYSEVVAAATGDITDIVAGSGLTGGAVSGSATLALDYENLTGNLIPSANNTYSLGSVDSVWKDVYVGPGSLYVNGQKVLEDNSGTIQVSADANQNIHVLTTGTGDIELTAGGDIQVKSDLVVSAGKTITSSGGVKFASNVNMNSNTINNLDDPVEAQDGATKAYVDSQLQTKDQLAELTGDTDDVTEGSVNLYFTDARADARIAAADTGDLTEGTNLYYTSTRAQTDANIAISNNSTSDLAEGTNLYFTTARANTSIDDYVSGGTGISVSSGVISSSLSPFDTDNLAEGSSSLYFTTARAEAAVDGHLTGGDGVGYTGGTIALDGTVVRTSGDQTVNGEKTFSDDLVIGGNLTVNGTTVTVNTETLFLEDNIITLNYGTTGSPTENAGIQVDRGDAADVFVTYNEASDQWQFTNNGVDYTKIAEDTDDLAEGSSNLYYTDARAKSAVSAAGDLSYNSTSGEFSFTERTDAEVRGLISASGDLSYNSTTGVISYSRGPGDIESVSVTAGAGLTGGGSAASGAFSATLNIGAGTGISVAADSIAVNMGAFDTADLAEGTNLYFTNARADARIAAADTDDLSEGTGNLYFTNARADARADARIAAADTDDLGEGSTNLYYTNSRADARVDAGFSSKSTSDLSEGSNQYFTTARARGAISVSGDLSYNSSTGVISYSRGPGDITAVTAGAGLTGGGSTGAVTVNVGAGNGISVAADSVAVDTAYVRGLISASGDISYNSTTGVISFTNDAGDIESVSVTAGAGLTGGGSAASGAFAATLNIGAGTGISVAADSVSVNMGAFDTADLAEGASNLYYTNARADARVNAGFSSKSTSDLSEGSNLYYTDARVNADIDGRVTKAFVDALNVDADTLDGINSSAFLRSNANDSHSGTITPSTNNAINLGSSSLKYANVYATTFQGQSTQARYADLAEKYATDAELEAGTVVMFGGEAEVKACDSENCHAVAGVISTDPAYMMNSDADGQYVALAGRVPTKVTGPVAKGDLMVSAGNGMAKANNDAQAGRIIGKAIGSSEGGEAVIEVLVNMM